MNKYFLGGAVAVGLVLGIFVTRGFYADDMDKLRMLETEKEFYQEIREDQRDQIDTLSKLLTDAQVTIVDLNKRKVSNVKEELLGADFTQCPISDELLNALDSVGREKG